MADSDDVATKTKEASTGEAVPEGEELSLFLQKLQTPIRDDAPAGDKVTYDDDFQQLKTQINEIGAASGGANYDKIVELGRRILAEKSKDLRAASYLVVGEARLNGAAGMAEAVKGVRVLIDTFWEELYPPKRRMHGRGNALQFISDRLGDWLETTQFESSDREALVAARDDLKAIQAFGLSEMGEHAPALSGLNKVLERAISKLPEPETDREPDSGPATEKSATGEPTTEEATGDDREATSTTASRSRSSSGTAAPVEIDSEGDASASIIKAATYLRTKNASNPTPYRLIRALRWGMLRHDPPNENGKTQVAAPREQRRTYLNGLLKQGEYETLLEEGEASFQAGTFHFWLDLQRLLDSALEALGKPYADAHQVVQTETAMLIERLPGLITLTYRDGTPFADALTVDWIETQVLPTLAGNKGGEDQGATGESHLIAAQQYEEARKQLSTGDLAGALEVMQNGAAQDASQKEAFHRQLYTATLCLKGGQPLIAQPLLDDLDRAIDRHALNAWDPSLALEVWKHCCQCYDALAHQAPEADKERLFQKADQAFEKLCRVDATQAVSIASRRAR